MLKVIIADNEERVCRLIQMLVDWDALEMEVAGTAANGLEALELVERLLPDILITDIRMPGCDGLELIERAKSISPGLEIVLISGYAQFEYAQTAIRFGVGGYILKPIKREILNSTLEKLGEKCRERAAQATEARRLIQDSSRNAEIMRGRLLEDLLQGRLISPSRELMEREYGFDPAGELLQIVILKIDCTPELYGGAVMEVIKKTAEEIFASAVSELCGAWLFQYRQSAGYGVLSYDRERQTQIRRNLRECLYQLEARLFGDVEFSLALSGAAESAEELPASFRDAQKALQERLVEGTGRLYEGELPETQLSTKRLLDKYGRAVEYAADTLNTQEADRAVSELESELYKLPGLRGHVILDTVLAAGRAFLLRIGAEAGLSQEFEERCALCDSGDKLFEYLRGFQRKQIDLNRSRLESEAIRPVRIARQYVMEHYSGSIALEDVCAAAGLSVSYFSTLFKKETGEGFSQYVARIRIERAKELLQETNKSVAEICESVGYSDLKHFSATFKKMTRLSPSQYRKLYG